MTKEDLFIQEYIELCKKHGLYLGGYYIPEVLTLTQCLEFDDEGEELTGLDALLYKYREHELDK